MRWVTVSELVDPIIQRSPGLERTGTTIKKTIHQAVLAGGKPVRLIADVLHGTWLGHPLHSVLTDTTVGAWTFAAVFDALSLLSPSRKMRRAADKLTSIGVLVALPTAASGMTDYSTIKRDAASYGFLHAILNSVALVLYLSSVLARRNRQRALGIRLSGMGLGVLLASAWLGGDMVYRLRVGVNHAPAPTGPDTWHPVISETALVTNNPLRVDVAGLPVVVVRTTSGVYALSAVCAHAGGPLEKGAVEGDCIQCPWHDSVYDLHDGGVVHGPSTYTQPAYEARVRDGQIEVRYSAAHESSP